MIEIYFSKNGVKKGSLNDLEELENKKVWIDITDISQEEGELMTKYFYLHPLTVEDLFGSNSRIKVEEFKDYLFCIFYGLKKSKKFELEEINFVIGKNFIITNHKDNLPFLNKIRNNPEKMERLFDKGTDFLFHYILDNMIDNFMPILEKIDDEIDEIEEEVTIHPNPGMLRKILDLKRQIVHIKKITFPQREKISYLAKNEYKLISKKSLPYFRDIYDHSIRVSDSIENYREAIGGTFDAYMSAVSNNMNEVMKTLSVIATIALPLTVISGIYGTNFKYMPGANSSYGFWGMILGMVLLVMIMLYFFKKRKWF